jgi:protein phosphatase
VVLIGPSGSGKSTFAVRHFQSTEVISSDECRALVSDDENNQDATPAAFRILYAIARERLRAHRLVVVDATNVQARSRKPLIALARKRNIPAVAVVFDLSEGLCVERNARRPARSLPPDVVHRQHLQMTDSLPGLDGEGFHQIYILESTEAVEAAVIVRLT